MRINSNLIRPSLVVLSLAFPNNSAYSESILIEENKIEVKLNSLEIKIETGLKECVEELESNSTPQIAFIDALQELEKYNMVLSHFHSPALKQYGVNDESNPCYKANEDIKRMNEIIESNL